MNIVMAGNAGKQVTPKRPKKEKVKRSKEKGESLPVDSETKIDPVEETISAQDSTVEEIAEVQADTQDNQNTAEDEASPFTLPPIGMSDDTVDTSDLHSDCDGDSLEEAEEDSARVLDVSEDFEVSEPIQERDKTESVGHHFSLSKKRKEGNNTSENTSTANPNSSEEKTDAVKSGKKQRKQKKEKLRGNRKKALKESVEDEATPVDVESEDMVQGDETLAMGSDFLTYPIIVGALVSAIVLGYLIANTVVDKVIH